MKLDFCLCVCVCVLLSNAIVSEQSHFSAVVTQSDVVLADACLDSCMHVYED